MEKEKANQKQYEADIEARDPAFSLLNVTARQALSLGVEDLLPVIHAQARELQRLRQMEDRVVPALRNLYDQVFSKPEEAKHDEPTA